MTIINRIMNVLLFLSIFAALSAKAQANLVSVTNKTMASSPPATQTIESQTNQDQFIEERIQQVRAVCIQNRRSICGKILKILPEGMVVDSGYTNLFRKPIDSSWLVPGTVTTERVTNLVESNNPGCVCVGLVFLTDAPKSRRFMPKPKLYDYVIIEGYPAGHYTYTSVGNVHRTVRKFSAKLEKAVDWNLQIEDKTQVRAPEVK
jgi:hypothetical protein